MTVRIYGESYTLRTAEPQSRIEEVARLVDSRMREVAASGKVVSTTKIAVLAALHLADELLRLRGQHPESAGGETAARIAALVATLDRALAPQAPPTDP